MKNNPFTSDIFSSTWSKHFNHSTSGWSFGFINDLSFLKHKHLPIYCNYGKTHTKGISYSIDNSNFQDIKGKVLLIYDVPTFFNIPEVNYPGIKQCRVRQYPGFSISLSEHADLNEFMARTFKKSSRYKLKKYRKKLETCFDINYKMFYGEMSKEEYDFVFKAFKDLLVKRFDDKQVYNNNLEQQEWDFYYDVAYPMILAKKAGLFVIYDGNRPIAVTLNYFSDNVLFDAITVFDIDYSKFHLGSINIMKLIEWSIEQNINVFDFSKGYFHYKKRWASKEYDFEYHIIYDSSSLNSKVIALALKNYFRLKQGLRDKKVNEKLHQFTFWMKHILRKKEPTSEYEFSAMEQEYPADKLLEIDHNDSKYHFLKKVVFDFLYLNNEAFGDLSVYKTDLNTQTFLFYGKTSNAQVRLL